MGYICGRCESFTTQPRRVEKREFDDCWGAQQWWSDVIFVCPNCGSEDLYDWDIEDVELDDNDKVISVKT